MKRVIMVLGMYRSGTSMVTQICQFFGAYLGEDKELMMDTKDNSDGCFVNKEISSINDRLLRLCRREWYSLQVLQRNDNSPQIGKAVEELNTKMHRLLEKSDVVAITDPRISILFPLWERVLSGLKAEIQYVWVIRNPLEVAESLRKRDGYSQAHSLLLWAYYNLNILKFLKQKEYLLLNYTDVLENVQLFESLLQVFGKKLDGNLGRELEHIVKQGYHHSNASKEYNENICPKLFLEMYHAIFEGGMSEEKISVWEKNYHTLLVNKKNKIMDYDILEDVKCLEGKKLIIYGAGNFGKEAAHMLQELGFYGVDFCDKDILKHGKKIMGGTVFSIAEIEKMENLCVIIALEKRDLQKEVEQTLLYIKGTKILSFFALKAVWKYFVMSGDALENKIRALSSWYEALSMRGKNVQNACKCPILIYQNGKVGSSTVSQSLRAVGIENAHIHRFFFKNDIVGELLLGENQEDFIKKSSVFQIQQLEYVKNVRNEIKGKKIITMVRDPIAVDLSTVFQWIGTGVTDRYFAEQLKQGKAFQQIVTELMVRIKDRLFNWFNEELKELTGIDVYAQPFDKEKGYTMIKKNNVEILLLKAERLSQMTEVIRDFTSNDGIELANINVGKEKEYAHIYSEVKRRLKLPKEYVEHYYYKDSYMDHFYAEEEKKQFLIKWTRCIEECS